MRNGAPRLAGPQWQAVEDRLTTRLALMSVCAHCAPDAGISAAMNATVLTLSQATQEKGPTRSGRKPRTHRRDRQRSETVEVGTAKAAPSFDPCEAVILGGSAGRWTGLW